MVEKYNPPKSLGTLAPKFINHHNSDSFENHFGFSILPTT